MKLTLGYSPCPNDTSIFGALALGLVQLPGLDFEIRLEDVETLNQLAKAGTLDVTKISYAALADGLLEEYQLLASGGALGRGCGPLIISRTPLNSNDLASARLVTPGNLTTAHLLTRLFAPTAQIAETRPFDQIMPAVAAGEFDAGVIIHESRFTYPEFGLHLVADLGEWWEQTTGKPIPLGGIIARRSLGAEIITQIEQGIAHSLEFARHNPDQVQPYIASHAQEMDPQVQQQHIGLYVNEFSSNLGEDGWAAVNELLTRAAAIRTRSVPPA
ncbi:MAG TPA: 1,4-dihydroxy-6-naphthoate synthase [Acidobacteriota bacterium]|nr:1,4-dihydroxy-6-naphthoate synthase [Acidobacteriota bacterium]HNH84731.1 1,4-dihydroxy-6-naphthoate synthase [Acidobacteriota bacterium]